MNAGLALIYLTAKRGKPAVIKKSRGRSKATVTVPTATPCKPLEADTICVPQAHVVNSVPMTVVRLPNGAIGIQPSVAPHLQTFGTPIMPAPSFNLQSQPTNPMRSHNNTKSLQCTSGTSWQLITSMPNMLRMLAPNSMVPATENRVSNLAPIPMKLVQVGSHPLLTGQQFYLMTSGTSTINTSITAQNSSEGQVHRVAMDTDDSDLYNYSNPATQLAKFRDCATPVNPDQNNSCIVLSETYKDIIVKNIHADTWNNNDTTHSCGVPIQFPRSDPDLCDSYDMGGDIIDLADLAVSVQESQQPADGINYMYIIIFF